MQQASNSIATMHSAQRVEVEENRKLHKGFEVATDVFYHSAIDQKVAQSFASHAAHKLRARSEIMDMLKYFVFLAMFLAVVIHGSSSDARFTFGRVIQSQILEKEFQLANTSVYKSYLTVDNIDEFYEFLAKPFWFSVYAAGSFDGDTTYPSGALYNQRGFLGGVGQIVGSIRIGQLRVRAQPCSSVIDNNSLDQPWCFPEYSSSIESKDPFGHHHVTYNPTSHSSEPSFISVSNRVYPGPTFSVDLPNQESSHCDFETMHHCEVYEKIEELRTTKFFDAATRAIFVDFSVYNYNADIVAVVRLFLEQTIGGGLQATKNVVVFKPWPTHTAADRATIILEALLYVVVFSQAYTALKHIRKDGLAYYRVRGSFTNDVNIVLFFGVAVLKVLALVSLPSEFPSEEYINFRSSANYDYLAQSINSLNCFLSILKIFRYLSFLPTFSILTATVSNALHELLGLFIMIAILLFGGSLAFTLAFGTSLAHYSVLLNSFYSLMGIFTLKFDASETFEANRLLGPLFFISFVALIVLVIMHMLIACFANAYMEQKETYMFAKNLKIGSLGHEIFDHLLYHMIFKIPYFGPRVFQPMYERNKTSQSQTPMSRRKESLNERTMTSSNVKLKSQNLGLVVPVNTEAINAMKELEEKNQNVFRMVDEIEASHQVLVSEIDDVISQLSKAKMHHGPQIETLYEHLNSLMKLEEEFEGCIDSLMSQEQ
ncbi:hypothetical protein THRCLA_20738 [Thraustotheca clavata]|uniref:Uncharacterized protein n=1 Tax=Thraustotheca clavata TaxID=74557 RepID=A0A1W0A4P9_9STRA|nr:hypothetical protein THRCLA_20738 [Thraustotheca clavata]